MINVDKLLEVAKQAALEAGAIHMEYFGKKKEISYKLNEFDLVTNVDKSSEEKIMSTIKNSFPEHNFLGEESGTCKDFESDFLWIIDPLDGTTNYTHNFPQFAVSIGLFYKGKPYLGVVYDAFKKEMFWAAENKGAFLNSEPIEVTKQNELKKSLLSTGFPYEKAAELEENLKYFKEFLYKAQAVRRPGSASLDLCYVACGRLDGFWEMSLSPWDVAAGICIIAQAGGKVTNFNSDKFDANIRNIIASNNHIHAQISDIITECQNK